MIKRFNKFVGFSILLAVIVVAVHPLRTQAQTVGAGVLKVTKNNVEYEVVSFDRLLFKYQPPNDVEHPDGTVTKGSGKHMPIPPEIMALNGKRIAIKGFVMPLEVNGQKVKSFLLADELVTCLFCAMLGYDQWMMGTVVPPQGFDIKDDQYDDPITIYGTLQVGEELQEGQLVSLYRIKADAFEGKKQKMFGLF